MKLFSCIEASRPELLRHWLQHHIGLGIEHFYLTVHLPREEPKRSHSIESILHDFGVTPVHWWYGTFSSDEKHRYLTQMIDTFATSGEWIIPADIDEFRTFPSDLEQFISRCEAAGSRYVLGELLDRIAVDGSLPTITSEPSIWEQFPLASHVTRSIVSGWSAKLVMLRAGLPFTYGHHYLREDVREALATRQYQQVLPVHHFKWDESCWQRLSDRIETFRSQGREEYRESEGVLQFLEHHERKFPLDHPKVSAFVPLEIPKREAIA